MVEKIKKLIDIGFTQQSIANGIGVSKAAVNQWVKGIKNPSAANEQKFNMWLQKIKKEVANF